MQVYLIAGRNIIIQINNGFDNIDCGFYFNGIFILSFQQIQVSLLNMTLFIVVTLVIKFIV